MTNPAEAATRENDDQKQIVSIVFERVVREWKAEPANRYADLDWNTIIYRTCIGYAAALSTHQQQGIDDEPPYPLNQIRHIIASGQKGAESELVKRLRDVEATADTMQHAMLGAFPEGASGKAWQQVRDVLRDAIDALSRAPQPDTVTEEMVEAAWRKLPGALSPSREQVRAALTAALNAKGTA